MRFLLSSILILSLLAGCVSYPKKMGFVVESTVEKKIRNPYFSDNAQDYVYKASINIFENTFGGILVLKKIETSEHRIVFTTELGNTIFDFSFKGDVFKVNRILKEMDKEILIAILKKDFEALIKETPSITAYYSHEQETLMKAKINGDPYFYRFKENQLNQLIRVGHQKEKVLFSFSKINDNLANRIIIDHKNIKLRIELNAF